MIETGSEASHNHSASFGRIELSFLWKSSRNERALSGVTWGASWEIICQDYWKRPVWVKMWCVSATNHNWKKPHVHRLRCSQGTWTTTTTTTTISVRRTMYQGTSSSGDSWSASMTNSWHRWSRQGYWAGRGATPVHRGSVNARVCEPGECGVCAALVTSHLCSPRGGRNVSVWPCV